MSLCHRDIYTVRQDLTNPAPTSTTLAAAASSFVFVGGGIVVGVRSCTGPCPGYSSRPHSGSRPHSDGSHPCFCTHPYSGYCSCRQCERTRLHPPSDH